MNVNVGIVEIKPGKDVEEILKNATVVLLSVKTPQEKLNTAFSMNKWKLPSSGKT